MSKSGVFGHFPGFQLFDHFSEVRSRNVNDFRGLCPGGVPESGQNRAIWGRSGARLGWSREALTAMPGQGQIWPFLGVPGPILYLFLIWGVPGPPRMADSGVQSRPQAGAIWYHASAAGASHAQEPRKTPLFDRFCQNPHLWPSHWVWEGPEMAPIRGPGGPGLAWHHTSR